MIFLLQTFLSALFVILVILYPPQYGGTSSNTALKVDILNPTDSPVGLCWLSTYDRESELIARAPEGCYRIGQGVQNIFKLNTYTGHRFIIVPWDKDEASVTSTFSKTIPTIFLYMKPELTFYTVDFKSSLASLKDITSLDDVWQQLLRNRHYFMIFVVSIYLLSLQFSSHSSSSSSRKASQRHSKMITKSMPPMKTSDTQLLVPRHSFKCFAVLNMIVNHLSYLLFPDRPAWQLVGTLPADLVGSSQVFWFLVGLNPGASRPDSVRSESSIVLVSFVLLEHFCRLPKPLTFETLLTVVAARSLLSADIFAYNEEKKCCAFAQLPIWVHALCCCALISTNNIFNANGLRLVQCVGILYAVTGRLFHSCHAAAPKSARAAHYLWLLAAWGFQLKLIYRAKLITLDIYSPQAFVVAVCLVGAVCQAAMIACPVKQSWWVSSSMSVAISRYSLEIYVFHFVLLWYYYGA